jgi:hypothetical protein
MSEVANKRLLVEAVNSLVKKSAPEMADLDAVCLALAAVFSDLLCVKVALRMDVEEKDWATAIALIDKANPAWDL